MIARPSPRQKSCQRAKLDSGYYSLGHNHAEPPNALPDSRGHGRCASNSSSQGGAPSLRCWSFSAYTLRYRKAFEPFFKHLADRLGDRTSSLLRMNWAGIAIALTNGQADLAWMGPWGYVLAHHQGGAQAIATVKYDGRPFYHAIILARPGLTINSGRRAQGFADFLCGCRLDLGLADPDALFPDARHRSEDLLQYRDGASHPANVTAVANSQVDLATDFDRELQRHGRSRSGQTR